MAFPTSRSQWYLIDHSMPTFLWWDAEWGGVVFNRIKITLPNGLWPNNAGAGKDGGWQRDGLQDQRFWLPGVLCQDEGWRARSFRDGHQSGSAGAQAQEEKWLHAAVSCPDAIKSTDQ